MNVTSASEGEQTDSASRQLIVVHANAVPNRDDELHAWYDEVHVPDLLGVPGVVGAQRFKLHEHQLAGGRSTHSYLAVYEVEGDMEAVLREIARQREAGEVLYSDALDRDTPTTVAFAALGPLQGRISGSRHLSVRSK